MTASANRRWPLIALLIALAGVTAYAVWIHFEYQDAQLELAKTEGQRDMLKKLEAQHADLSTAHDECKKTHTETVANHKTALADACVDLDKELENMRTDMKRFEEQAAQNRARRDAFNYLAERFLTLGGRTPTVSLGSDRGRMIIRLPSAVLFSSGSVELSREGQLVLMEAAILLRQFPERRIRIGGHTDSLPLEGRNSAFKNNWELSSVRALTVLGFLIEAGVPRSIMSVAGYGANEPLADNRSAKGRQKNRRIEIELIPEEGELPWLFEKPNPP